MFKISRFTKQSLFVIPLATALLFSQASSAQVYKWRDARGVMQYSENPPVANATKATASELVNYFQKKDVCSLPEDDAKQTANLSDNTPKKAYSFLAQASDRANQISKLSKNAEDLKRRTSEAYNAAKNPKLNAAQRVALSKRADDLKARTAAAYKQLTALRSGKSTQTNTPSNTASNLAQAQKNAVSLKAQTEKAYADTRNPKLSQSARNAAKLKAAKLKAQTAAAYKQVAALRSGKATQSTSSNTNLPQLQKNAASLKAQTAKAYAEARNPKLSQAARTKARTKAHQLKAKTEAAYKQVATARMGVNTDLKATVSATKATKTTTSATTTTASTNLSKTFENLKRQTGEAYNAARNPKLSAAQRVAASKKADALKAKTATAYAQLKLARANNSNVKPTTTAEKIAAAKAGSTAKPATTSSTSNTSTNDLRIKAEALKKKAEQAFADIRNPKLSAAQQNAAKSKAQALKKEVALAYAMLAKANPSAAAEAIATTTKTVQQTARKISAKPGLPAVDLSKVPAPAKGSGKLEISKASPGDAKPDSGVETAAFRTVCNPSHMANNDPIVYPNQEGASHHHTFFGNTSTDHKTNLVNLPQVGNSTCAGGIANRSSYWVPSMIDTSTNAPIKPDYLLVYYKTNSPKKVKQLPKGLRMIAKPHSEGLKTRYTCNENYGTRSFDKIANCKRGSTMEYQLEFPGCWDGKNLDSPDHISHLAYGGWTSCPSSHPVHIPVVTFNVTYKVKTNNTKNWRLASDKTGESSGYSVHGDWVNGWDAKIAKVWTERCLKAGKDCHGYLLGDGRLLDDEPTN